MSILANPHVVSLAKSTFRRVNAGLESLADDLPTPTAEERLVPVGDNGSLAAVDPDPKNVEHRWLGMAGFVAGQYWLLDAVRPSKKLADAAMHISLRHYAPEASTLNNSLNAQYGSALGHRLTGDERLKELALKGADPMAQHFDEHLQMFPRWAGEPRARAEARWKSQGLQLDEVVATVDDVCGAGVLYWSAKFREGHRDLVLRAQAALRRHGMIAENGKVTQGVTCNSEGKNIRLCALQGSFDWTRAQGWGVLASGAAFEATGNAAAYDDFERATDYYVNEMIGSGTTIPPYDMGVPDRENAPRDTCTATIIVATILRMARLEPERTKKYGGFVERTLEELYRRHLTPGGTLLHGCWGTYFSGVKEFVMPFGNYYLTEAVARILIPEHAVWGESGHESVGS